jgi:two-component system NarL family response regulator
MHQDYHPVDVTTFAGPNGRSMNDHLQKSQKLSVLIVDDHVLFRTGVAIVINKQHDMGVVAQASDSDTGIRLFAEHRPDVALVDVRIPGMDGVELIENLRQQYPAAKLIILTTYDTDDDIDRALRAGAKGFLLKDATSRELVDAIRAVNQGKTVVAPSIAAKLAEHVTQPALTAREMSVLRLVVNGKANKEIAGELFISEGTVKIHLTHMFEKLAVASRTEAIGLAIKRGLVRFQ